MVLVALALGLALGCSEAHVIEQQPNADAGVTCRDPEPQCMHFDEPRDALIPWHYPYGTCDNPHLVEYAEASWFILEGMPCADGRGTCDALARCVTP